MSQLAQLQSGFQAYLLALEQGGPFKNSIVDDAKVGAQKRLAIYYDAYRLRLIEALATAYPKLKVLVGDDFFDTTARSYIEAYPSAYRNLRWYGAQMSELLQETLSEHPIAAELAEFEWTLSLAFDAAEAPTLQVADLASIPPESWGDLKFVFQPSLHMLPMRWNTIAVWKALDIEENPPAFEQRSVYETWLVWRRELSPHFRSLDGVEECLLNLARHGSSFGDICASLFDQMDEETAMMQAAQYLANWLQEGIISGIEA